ncbi:MAG: M28 family peptidase [Bacteroidota bacterium]
MKYKTYPNHWKLCCLVFLLHVGCQTSPESINSKDYVTLLQEEVKGDLAYETTAYVAQYWRVVGNPGFDSSIVHVANRLEMAGYVLEETATANDRLVYRIEKRPMGKPAWDPLDASLQIVGDGKALLDYSSNRNMIAINSFSTPLDGIRAEVIRVQDIKQLDQLDLKGKIVYFEGSLRRIYRTVFAKGAVGVLTYDLPDYLQPKKNETSIQFRSVPYDPEQKPWAIALSYQAKTRLEKAFQNGNVMVDAMVKTNIFPSEELTIVAEVRGAKWPDQRLVCSAHVQEPGANDNASGVGAALEMATVTARLVREQQLDPQRTLTFLWGDEIVSTRRYVEEDSVRAANIRWGISLDMVGENTEITGGSFLIEKMPDPSAIWTRGKDEHSEWGGSPMDLSQMQPHYLNDFVLKKFLEQGQRANWKVKPNPFEGGSDHVPFLRADIPGVLFWHFTDQFYHTDNDRIDKVSKTTLRNVQIAALDCAYTLINADEQTAKEIIQWTADAALVRLQEETMQGKLAIDRGEVLQEQQEIIDAWEDWYISAVSSATDMVDNEELVSSGVEKAHQRILSAASTARRELESHGGE